MVDQEHNSISNKRVWIVDGEEQLGILSTIGQYRLVPYTASDNPPSIYWDDQKIGNFLSISGYLLFIVGFWWKSVGFVILSVAQTLGQVYDDINQNANATARVGHSYRYLVKEGQIYTTYGWQCYYVSTSREWYAHGYGIYADKNNITRQNAADFGYAGRTDYAPNYNNNGEISYQAQYRWYYNLSPGREDWLGVYPDPPQQ